MESWLTKEFQRKRFDIDYKDVKFALDKLRNSVRRFYERRLIEMVIPKDSKDLSCLDVACGHGVTSFFLSNFFEMVLGLDFSPSSLGAAGTLMKYNGIENVKLVLCDAETIPLKDHSVDVVFFKDFLHHTPHPISSIREMRRVVNVPGSICGIESNAFSLQTHLLAKKFVHERGMLQMRKNRVKKMFRESGIANVEIKSFGLYPYHIASWDGKVVRKLLPGIFKLEKKLSVTSLGKFSNYLIIKCIVEH